MVPDETAFKLRVGRFTIGLVGLDAALSEAAAQHLPADEDAARRILERLRKQNYIPPAAEPEYLRAIQREYGKRLGQSVFEPPIEGIDVKVLGPGCPSCDQLEQMVRKLMAAENISGNLEHVRDLAEIGAYGIVPTPGLAINDQVKCAARVPSAAEIKAWIQEALKS
jgi:small redox-active disulfide protein 2